MNCFDWADSCSQCCTEVSKAGLKWALYDTVHQTLPNGVGNMVVETKQNALLSVGQSVWRGIAESDFNKTEFIMEVL